jgi:threonine/homoserine/homoserine lactone efflux protein
MLAIETIGMFFAASVALALAPGPDNLFVLAQSALHGKKAGLLVTLGLCTGLFVHTTAVALGVAVIFQTSEFAFVTLKLVGAAYLLYLAYGAFNAGAFSGGKTPESSSARELYLRGIIMNATNPKVALFFLAFLPQFTDPSLGSVTVQIVFLGGLFLLATLWVFGSIAWFAGEISERFISAPRAQVVLNKLAAIVFGILALRLILMGC